MDDRKKAILEFQQKHPTLDKLIGKLLSSSEADFLFERETKRTNEAAIKEEKR